LTERLNGHGKDRGRGIDGRHCQGKTKEVINGKESKTETEIPLDKETRLTGEIQEDM
jgi:hypothetical protein